MWSAHSLYAMSNLYLTRVNPEPGTDNRGHQKQKGKLEMQLPWGSDLGASSVAAQGEIGKEMLDAGGQRQARERRCGTLPIVHGTGLHWCPMVRPCVS